jgi:hypothetical protein
MEFRMYFLVMYNLSPIQKGIQAGHAALEYSQKYKNDPDYLNFVANHKTFIVLDGGSSRDMECHLETLDKMGVDYAEFREPDLNDSVSAIACILSEKEYNYTNTFEGYNKVGAFFRQFSLAR